MQTKILNLLEGNAAVSSVHDLDVTLSLAPFKRHLEDRLASNRNIKSAFIEFVLEQFKKHPDLNEGLTIPKLMAHRELLDLIYAALSVSVEDEKGHLWGLCAPITPIIFY